MTIGQRLKEARLAAGLSQRQLCGDAITRNMLSQIENGVARPSMETLQTLARRLNKPVSYFLDEEHNPNESARECYRQRDYESALKALEATQNQDEEHHLLRALSCLELAQQAVTQGRLPYAVSLLEDCAAAGNRTAYFTQESERRRLLLLAQAKPDKAAEILAALPPEDMELLVRAQVALQRQEAGLAAVILDAAQDRQSRQWDLLRGQAAFGQGDYRTAVTCFHRVEESGETSVYSWLEQCYQRLEDYKMAYHYACKQK